MAKVIKIEWMLATGVYDTAKPTPSSMDYPYAHVIEYR